MASLFVIITFIFISHFRAEGIRAIDAITTDPINTNISITTKNGDIYDCIDFYKQPAFQNPLLNNLISSKVLESKTLSRAHTRKALSGLGFNVDGAGCPFGTVPILRTKFPTENDNYMHSPNIITTQDNPNNDGVYCQALLRTHNRDLKYLGVSGDIGVYNPLTYAPHQWSGARLRLSNAPDVMEVGLMVHPSFFGDNKTHLYVGFLGGDGKGCFNLYCSGFIQVGRDVGVGATPDKTSQPGGDLYSVTLSITKDKDDGNWWVSIRDYRLGYWPKTLFNKLPDFANQVEWGGEVYIIPSSSILPEMGDGHRPNGHSDLASLIGKFKTVDENFVVQDPPKDLTTQVCDAYSVFYSVQDLGNTEYDGRAILFGGPHDDY